MRTLKLCDSDEFKQYIEAFDSSTALNKYFDEFLNKKYLHKEQTLRPFIVEYTNDLEHFKKKKKSSLLNT